MKATVQHSLTINLDAAEARALGAALKQARKNEGNALSYEEVGVIEDLFELLVFHHFATDNP